MHYRFRDLCQPEPSSTPAATHKATAAARRNKRDEELVNRVLYLIIVVLLALVLRDVYHVHVLRRRIKVNEVYVRAVRSSDEGWTVGWKLEELQSKLQTQNAVLKSLVATLHTPFLSFVGSLRGGPTSHKNEAALARELMVHVENVSAMVTWTCATRPDTPIRVGQSDFFDSTPENCLLHSAATAVTPSSIFEVLDLGGGYVGLRSFANGKFVKVTPPSSGKSSDPWWLDLASPVAGLAERFRMDGPLVYNELLQGHLKCGSSGHGGAPVLGVAGTNPLTLQTKLEHHFQLRPVTSEEVAHARVLKAMAKTLRSKSESEVTSFQESSRIKLQYESLSAQEHISEHGAKIAILIPVTSKATAMSSVKDSPFFKNTLASFLASIDWQSNRRFSFTFFLGFDQGDALYDTGDAWSDMRQAFTETVHGYLADAYASSPASVRQQAASLIGLRLRHFTDKAGSPSQVVSALAREAYDGKFDYFFQVNDDTVIQTRDWPTVFTSTLADSPLLANLGVTGPFDTNNPRILTHAFVHRTHLEIFDGRFFPKPFNNWWSDDWISAVYGRYGTFRAHGVQVLHNIHAQKQGRAVQRYQVDESARDRLRGEVLHGFTKVNAYLVSRGRPRLPLPDVCGYVPLAELVYDYLSPPTSLPKAGGGRKGSSSVVDSRRATTAAADRSSSRQGAEEGLVQYEIQGQAMKEGSKKQQQRGGRGLVDMPIWGPDEDPPEISPLLTGGGGFLDPFALD